MIMRKEIMCFSQFVFPHKNHSILSFQFMNFSAVGKTEVDRISVLKCNKRLTWHSSKCLKRFLIGNEEAQGARLALPKDQNFSGKISNVYNSREKSKMNPAPPSFDN